MTLFRIVLSAFILLTIGGGWASAQPRDPVPESLAPWADWVQRDMVDTPCIELPVRDHCSFGRSAQIDLSPDHARFQVTIHARKAIALELPGARGLWPQDVLVNDQAQAVLANAQGRPIIHLGAGEHRVQGQIPWAQEPRSLPLPDSFALVSVRAQGVPRPARFASDGALLLDVAELRESTVADRMDIDVFRLITDGVPLRVETRLRLRVSGQPRIEQIDGALLEGFAPLAFESDFAGRVDRNGKMTLQVQPGDWTVALTAVRAEPNDTLVLGDLPPPWPETEIWVLAQDPRFRQLTLTGGQTLDPTQTELPDAWRKQAAYRVQKDSTVELITASDQQVAAADRLTLVRRARLNFDGSGYELRDTITGTVRQSTRLDVGEALELGRASINGAPQIVTLNTQSGGTGLQIQHGPLQLSAESRVASGAGTFFMNGWAHRFEDVATYIELPPGYKLVTALGVDSTRGAWLDQWELIDVFLVILVAVAAARLYGLWMGLFAFAGMVIVHIYFPAFALYFLVLMGLATLCEVIPKGRLQFTVNALKYGALLLVFLQVAPFSLTQAKEALFPQLSRDFQSPAGGSGRARINPMSYELSPSYAVGPPLAGISSPLSEGLLSEQAALNKAGADKVVTQTGFGLSEWSGRELRLIWHGKVPADLHARLIILGPNGTLAAGLLQALFPLLILALVIVKTVDVSGGWRFFGKKRATGANTAAGVLALTLLGSGAFWPQIAQAQTAPAEPIMPQIVGSPIDVPAPFPPQRLLEDLRSYYQAKRANEAISCTPICSEIARVTLTLTPETFGYEMEVHAAKPSLVALPLTIDTWQPDTLDLDGATTEPLYVRQDGYVHLLVQAGITRVSARGAPPAGDRFTATFSQKPNHLAISTDGWTDFGLAEDGSFADRLQFIRDAIGTDEGSDASLTSPSDIAPYFSLSRLVTLDYSWTVVTNIRLLSPAGQAVQLRVPLMDGEAITSADIRTEDGFALVDIAPGTTQVTWLSVLAEAPEITLRAPQNQPWTEEWEVIANNTWDLDFTGLQGLRKRDSDVRHSFRPWPGESLQIAVGKPPSAGGQTKTISSVSNVLTQGLRTVQGELTLSLNASTAGDHILSFPPEARVLTFTINEVPQTILLSQGDLTARFAPGQHRLKINWEMARPLTHLLTSPELDLNFPAANVTTRFTVPSSRWVLWAQGEGAGPAILFWSTLPIWLLLAIAVSRLPFAGLRWWEFFLLFLGLTQSNYLFSFVVAGFVLAVHLSGTRNHLQKSAVLHNLRQIGLILWAATATGALLIAIYQGFDDWPIMIVEGSGSSTRVYQWYLDQIESALPQNVIYTLPILAYRILILLWALWLAVRIVRWLPIGWASFSKWGIFRPMLRSRTKRKIPSEAL